MLGDAAEVALLEQHAFVLFDMDAGGRLIAVNEPEGVPPPRLFLARGRTSSRMWFRSDVSANVVAASRKLAADLPRWDGQEPPAVIFDPLRQILMADAPITDESAGPAFRFGEPVDVGVEGVSPQLIDARSAHLLERYFPYTQDLLLEARAPVVGVVIDRWVVSACYSARKRPTACEAGVATEEAYRRRGLGALVVSAWRKALEGDGREPLYSTSWDNLASRALARKLRLIPYADTLSLT